MLVMDDRRIRAQQNEKHKDWVEEFNLVDLTLLVSGRGQTLSVGVLVPR